jgi:prevent-host-death family protein
MGISASDVIPLSHARANFSELAEEVKGGAEKIITKNGESYVALIDASRLGLPPASRTSSKTSNAS